MVTLSVSWRNTHIGSCKEWSEPSVPPAAAGRSVTPVWALPVVCPAGGAAATIPRSETPSWHRALLPPPPICCSSSHLHPPSSSVLPDDSCLPLPALPARVSGGSTQFYKGGRCSVAISPSSRCCPPETLVDNTVFFVVSFMFMKNILCFNTLNHKLF